MKKLKVFIIALLVIIGFAFMPPTVQASEVTTEPITEEMTTVEEVVTTDLITTEEVVEESEFDIDETLDKAKTWIVGVSLSIISSGLLSTVAYIVLSNLKNKALEQVNEAVAQNKISQATANVATKAIDDGIDLMADKFDKFDKNINEQIIEMNQSVQDLVEGFNTNFLSKLNQALTEYFAEEEE